MTDEYPYNRRVAKIINDELMDVYPPNPLRIIDALKDAGYHIVSTPRLEIRGNFNSEVSLELRGELDETQIDLKHRIHPRAVYQMDTEYVEHILRKLVEEFGRDLIRRLMMEEEWKDRLLKKIQERREA